MSVTRTAVALIGWLAAFPAGAEQLASHYPPQYDALHDNPDSGVETVVLRGLLGDYPANREATGTDWQPDSTPLDFRHESRIGLGAGATMPGKDIRVVRRSRYGATFGLRAGLAADTLWVTDGAPSRRLTEPGSHIAPLFAHEDGYRTTVVNMAASYSLPLSGRSSVFGYLGLPGAPAFGPPASYLRRFPSPGNSQTISQWAESPDVKSEVYTFGYVWRNVKVESSAFSDRGRDQKQVQPGWRKSGRLSFNPTPNWALQFSRRHTSTVDQLQPDQGIRRTTISATYNRAFALGNWQTTLAWGRNARRFRETSFGYLLESTLKLGHAHVFVGRLEQVGSDDLLRENESIDRRMFKMNKLTMGYVYDVPANGLVRYDVGALVSRHLVPSNMAAPYGADPTAFMMFVRIRLK